MKLNVFCETKSYRTEDQMPSSTDFTEPGQHSTYYQREGKASPASPPAPLNPRLPNALAASSNRLQGSILERTPVPAMEGAMPWGLFTAFAAALASFGFLFVMAFTGGIDLG